MLLPFLLRSKPPPSSLTLPTTQVDLKAFIYQQERTFTKPHHSCLETTCHRVFRQGQALQIVGTKKEIQ